MIRQIAITSENTSEFTFPFLGVIFVLLSLCSFIDGWLIKKNKIEVDATVIRTEETSSSEGGVSFCPVFCYDIEGRHYVERYIIGNMKPKYPNGTVVRIYCHRKNPNRILIPNDRTRLLLSLFFLVLGLIFLAIYLFG